jgi:Tfp pilus assembly protein PilE
MSSFKPSLIIALAAIVLVSTGSYWLRHERQTEASALRAANAQLRRQAFLQHQALAAHAVATAAPELIVSRVEATAAPVTPAAPESADYRFQGQATPVDTLQTMAWAMDRGDVDLMVKIITFDDAARLKVEAYWTSLPPAAQAQWPTVEILAATLLTNRGINQPYPRTDLLARATTEPITADRVVVHLAGTPKDREVYQKVGDAWRWVVTEALVDAYLEQVAREPAQ